MKTGILTLMVLTAALGLLGAACSQTENHGNSMMNHNGMNSNMMNSNTMNQNSMMNGGSMNHDSTMNHSEMKSDPDAAGQPYDLQFIDTMTAHHEGALKMAEMVQKKSQNEELKTFAQKMIDDQKKEIAQMKDWREKWFAGKPAAKNMEMPGMGDSMKMMSGGEMMKMESAGGKDFDLMFLDMMIPHHAGATAMAKEALTKAEHAELKTLATDIIKEQEAEIKKMSDWKTKWSK